MARGIATRALSGGHAVTLTAKDQAKAVELAEQLEAAAVGAASVTTAESKSAVADAEIVVLAVPYGAAKEIVASYGTQLDGKIVVDISNPVNASFDGLTVEPGTSAAEEIAKLAAPG